MRRLSVLHVMLILLTYSRVERKLRPGYGRSHCGAFRHDTNASRIEIRIHHLSCAMRRISTYFNTDQPMNQQQGANAKDWPSLVLAVTDCVGMARLIAALGWQLFLFAVQNLAGQLNFECVGRHFSCSRSAIPLPLHSAFHQQIIRLPLKSSQFTCGYGERHSRDHRWKYPKKTVVLSSLSTTTSSCRRLHHHVPASSLLPTICRAAWITVVADPRMMKTGRTVTYLVVGHEERFKTQALFVISVEDSANLLSGGP